MLQPMRTKFRKAHKGRIHGLASSAWNWPSADLASKRSSQSASPRAQIEAARRALTRHMKRSGRVCRFRMYPDVPVSKKPLEVRMGSGKGNRNWGGSRQARPHPVRSRRRLDRCSPEAALALAAAKLRLRRVSSSASASSRAMKPADIRAMTIDQIDDRCSDSKGAFQPAIPARQRAVGKHRPRPRSTPRHCAIEDGCALKAPGFGEIRPGEIQLDRGRFGQVEAGQVEPGQVEAGQVEAGQ